MNEYALITGASKGIGRSLAFHLAELGYNLLLTARNEDELLQITENIKNQFNVEAHYLALDLSGKMLRLKPQIGARAYRCRLQY